MTFAEHIKTIMVFAKWQNHPSNTLDQGEMNTAGMMLHLVYTFIIDILLHNIINNS